MVLPSITGFLLDVTLVLSSFTAFLPSSVFFNRTVIVFDDVTEMLPSFFLFLGIYGVGVRGVKGKRAVKRPNEP